ncbi:sperm-associated antigen 6-like isoform X5 [Leptopilina boulardi]|uniref:sperm-associated antigen 6-like isoform X5 n=1 Tax=Leptopilina boulardi TaxID=63433 RepID=UPI0021F67151|nr:sperm-associated antigen 6-like isoform X5 [Leptopilina boulardi]
MTARICQQVFEQYQKARIQFIQSVSDLAVKSYNVESLIKFGILEIISPLINDIVPTISQTALMTLGRLAGHDERIAQLILKKDVLSCIVKNFKKQNKFYKKAALFLLRSIAKHSSELSTIVINEDGLIAIMFGLEDFDSGVKESAAWAIGYIARHNKNLAQTVVDAGAVPLLVLCLQDPDLCLKQISTSALSDIGKHTTELAQSVIDSGTISILAKTFSISDAKLKRQVFTLLGNIAKHTVEFSELVVETEVFSSCLIHMSHPDENVVKAAATLTREVCKHTIELAEMIVNAGGIAALIELIGTTKSARVPAIMALGYIAGYSDQLALAVIDSQILPNDTRARRLFVTSGGLKKVQEIRVEPDSTLSEYITIINCCYPEELVRFYSPGYQDSLLDAVEQYQPRCEPLQNIVKPSKSTDTNILAPI